MKFKLKETADPGIYKPGNVIWNSMYDSYSMVVQGHDDDDIAKIYFLVDLGEGIALSQPYSSLQKLADHWCSDYDHLIVNPTLVEEGAER
ncbi:hypothetical protein [Levilactobacillus andaensis]|uniref:hypothetical protein n=1 Tax=Levilactobacillus andaensis TaxID=2799570 RepID=UPI001940A96B|nr:hypothetical protein [Levilactobacillus andaensis]